MNNWLSGTRSARAHPAIVGVVLLASALTVLTGCGPDDPASPTATPSTGQGNPAARMDPAQMQKIQECLSAAGLATPRAMPTGVPTALPTDPAGAPPGTPPAGSGAGLNSPKARAALKACGIDLPDATARPQQ